MALVPIHWIGFDADGDDWWKCQCDCGRLVDVKTDVVAVETAKACKKCDPSSPVGRPQLKPRKTRSGPMGGGGLVITPRTRSSEAGVFIKGNDGKWQAVHRQVAEKTLGRELLPGEQVIHLNGDHQDNRPENLAVRLTVPVLQLISVERQLRAA